jgi:hypothetical protein
MAKKRETTRLRHKRFSVSLPLEDYNALCRLVQDRNPPLRLNYAVQYAVRRLLDRASDPQMMLGFGEPVSDTRSAIE